MADTKKDVIGFDPLAWMKEPSAESGVRGAEGKMGASDAKVSASDSPHSALHTSDPPSAVQLGETLTIEQAATMHAELGRRLGAKNVVLDAGRLTRVDAAGLQLLAAFLRAAEGHGTGVEWRAPQPALRESARRLGLEGALRLPG